MKNECYKKVDWWDVNPPCMTENHKVYLAGRGYVRVKDLKAGDVIINEVHGRTERVKVANIVLHK